MDNPAEVDEWVTWALEQADAIDPIVRMRTLGVIGRPPEPTRKTMAEDQREKAEAVRLLFEPSRGAR